MSSETWQDIPKYLGTHQASSLGRIRSLGSRARVLSPVRLQGYLRVTMNKTKKELVHRLIASAFISNPQGKPEVNHKDGNKHNNIPGNLEWVTKSENMKHAFIMGLKTAPNNVGENHSQCIITPFDVKLVREMWNRSNKKKGTKKSIAEVLLIPRSTVLDILSGKSWKHVI